jgi:hypothetical protein
MPGRDTLWQAERQGPVTPSAPLTLMWENGQGLIFRRTIAVDADYLFTVVDEVENKTGAAVALHPFALISRHGMPKIEGFYILHWLSLRRDVPGGALDASRELFGTDYSGDGRVVFTQFSRSNRDEYFLLRILQEGNQGIDSVWTAPIWLTTSPKP